ncbi:MAG: DUF922 domain-containing protein [Candidatus Paceibacterota bacterium]|jgi:predicted secreted Zn-dependent protease
MKNTQNGFIVPFSIAIIGVLLVGGGVYVYQKKAPHQQNTKENSDTVVATSTKTNDVGVISTSTKSMPKTSLSPKPKFDPYAPMIRPIPGIHGMETEDLTNLKYPDCSAASTRSEYHPGPINLTSKTGLIVQEEKNYYNVNGTNESQIYYEIWNCTIPVRDMNNGADAITESYLNYDFKYDTINNKVCGINNVTVGVHVSYLLPRWIYAKEASGPLLNIWNTYFVAIQKHEEHHGSIAKEYGNKLYLYLSELSASKACVPSLDSVESKFNDTINELDAAQAKYDLEVDHGVKEGVFSPFDNI